MPIIKNPITIIKSGGEDKLKYRVSNLGDYTYENNEITNLKNYAFYIDTNLVEIRCNNVASIGSNAFGSASKLVSASFPSATNIGGAAFQSCIKLVSASFPSATSIGGSAFSGCSELVSASFPLVTNITGSSFYNCVRLASISFPSATIIGNTTFNSCTSLISASFPLVTSIGSSAFNNCTRLVSASFPSATSMGGQAFRSCDSLTSITLGNASQVCALLNANAIPGSSAHHVNIYVPINLIASYRTASNWSTLYNNGYISFLPIDGQLISVSNTNGTYSGDIAIANNGTATVILSANSGYELPTSVSVSGASYTYSNGVITLSNPTAEVNISATCPQATPSGYSVSVSSINTSPYGYGHAYYSTDNGATWIEITTGGLLVSNATQIKFRVNTENYAMEIMALNCQSLNVDIRSNFDQNVDSANITLNANVSDVVVEYIDND